MKLIEVEGNTAAFVFGRFNPPTIGHKKLYDKLASVSDVHFVFVSPTQDNKKNPLSRDQKIAIINAQFPDMADRIINDTSIRTIIDVMKFLETAGHKNVTMVAGSDRVNAFEDLLNKYNGKEYSFDTINVVSAGARDPDADTLEGVSASKAREAAVQGDFDGFATMFAGSEDTKRKIYNTLRQAMGVKESLKYYIDQVETKEAPRGTYFTKTGNLVKGKLTKAAKARGARETDPKDKQRSKVPPVTQRNPEEAAGVGIVTKQNTTKDVNKKTLGKIMKALRLK
jgi:nicotinic acid mononucleotide adenylyltransferase